MLGYALQVTSFSEWKGLVSVGFTAYEHRTGHIAPNL